eukprot:scaffold668970_cov47-Prasinocladus_malaysianus.AAC.1
MAFNGDFRRRNSQRQLKGENTEETLSTVNIELRDTLIFASNVAWYQYANPYRCQMETDGKQNIIAYCHNVFSQVGEK